MNKGNFRFNHSIPTKDSNTQPGILTLRKPTSGPAQHDRQHPTPSPSRQMTFSDDRDAIPRDILPVFSQNSPSCPLFLKSLLLKC
jgi:hypothetical protein